MDYIQKPKIVISEELKEELGDLRIVEGETYESIINRSIEAFKKHEKGQVEMARRRKK